MDVRNAYWNQQKILGYTEGFDILPVSKEMAIIACNLLDLPENRYLNGQSISLEQIKMEAAKFYRKYFKLHDVYYCSKKTLSTLVPNGSSFDEENIGKITGAMVLSSPFDLPVIYLPGHAMVGVTDVNVPLFSNLELAKKIDISFDHIALGNNLVDLSIATYIHEVGHVQTESIRGYARSLHNKEVITIFLEKLVASELDKNGDLLKISERYRLRNLRDNICILADTDEWDYFSLLNASIYVESTFKAEKLFDMYQSVTKNEDKLTILKQIQNVFDGKMVVEELLGMNNITLENSCNLSLIKRHL